MDLLHIITALVALVAIGAAVYNNWPKSVVAPPVVNTAAKQTIAVTFDAENPIDVSVYQVVLFLRGNDIARAKAAFEIASQSGGK